MDNARKTIADVYEISKHNAVVYAGLTLYEQNIGRMPMFDALIAIVCALAEENRVLKENAIWVAEHTITSSFVRPPRLTTGSTVTAAPGRSGVAEDDLAQPQVNPDR